MNSSYRGTVVLRARGWKRSRHAGIYDVLGILDEDELPIYSSVEELTLKRMMLMKMMMTKM